MSNPPRIDYNARGKMLNRARALARSGLYSDHKSIFTELEPMEEFSGARERLQEIRSQLDRLCAMARAKRPRFDIPGRN